MLFSSVLHRTNCVCCSVIQIMDMRNILFKGSSKVGYATNLPHILLIVISVLILEIRRYIAVKYSFSSV